DAALAVWLGIRDDEKADLPTALNAMHTRAWKPESESLDTFAYSLRQLLEASQLNLNEAARESLLVSRFIAAMPSTLQSDLRKQRVTLQDLKDALRTAKRNYSIDGSLIGNGSTHPTGNMTTATTRQPEPEPPTQDQLPSVQALKSSLGEANNATSNGIHIVHAVSDLVDILRKQQDALVSLVQHPPSSFAQSNQQALPEQPQRLPQVQYRDAPTQQYGMNNGPMPPREPGFLQLGRPRRQLRCDFCNIPGHKWRECRKRLAYQRQQQALQPQFFSQQVARPYGNPYAAPGQNFPIPQRYAMQPGPRSMPSPSPNLPPGIGIAPQQPQQQTALITTPGSFAPLNDAPVPAQNTFYNYTESGNGLGAVPSTAGSPPQLTHPH
ncbi:hypothetical protein FOZ62_031185, partial [Perkinsus olseni]